VSIKSLPMFQYAHLSPKHQQQAVDILAKKDWLRSISYNTNLAQKEKVPILENLETLAVQ